MISHNLCGFCTFYLSLENIKLIRLKFYIGLCHVNVQLLKEKGLWGYTFFMQFLHFFTFSYLIRLILYIGLCNDNAQIVEQDGVYDMHN